MAQIRHLGHIGFLSLAFQLPARDVWFETSAKVYSTHNCIDNGGDDQEYCDHGECSKGLPNREKSRFRRRLVHADKFEDKVGQSDKVKHLYIDEPLTSCWGRG